MQIARPYVERRFEDATMENPRKRYATKICDALERPDILKLSSKDPVKESLYDAVGCLLGDEESMRILLYFPLELLKGAPEDFQDAYMRAWNRLLCVHDVRENFHEGDCFELDARPSEGLERVVKCVHFLPWLLEAGYVSVDDLLFYFDDGNKELLWSIADTFEVIRDRRSMVSLSHSEQEDLLRYLQRSIPMRERKKQEPLYISKKRLEWLSERSSCSEVKLLTPDARLEGPFVKGFQSISSQLPSIVERLERDEIVMVGGSQLKGYGLEGSDLDVLDLKKIEQSFYSSDPEYAHICYDTVWLCRDDGVTSYGDKIRDLREVANRYAWFYHSFGDKKKIAERIEFDLLLYRLLHKGFSRFTGRKEFETSKYLSIDGDCPFYDFEYRRIATMLYAKYVYA